MQNNRYDWVKSTLLRILAERLEILNIAPETLPDNTNLIDAGIVDSMNLMEILVRLESECGASVDFAALTPDNFSTIRGICELLAKHGH